jgi:hypothetical protein
MKKHMIQCFAPDLRRLNKNAEIFDKLGLPGKFIDLSGPDRILKLPVLRIKLSRVCI